MQPASNIACSRNLANALLQRLREAILRRASLAADHVI